MNAVLKVPRSKITVVSALKIIIVLRRRGDIYGAKEKRKYISRYTRCAIKMDENAYAMNVYICSVGNKFAEESARFTAPPIVDNFMDTSIS